LSNCSLIAMVYVGLAKYKGKMIYRRKKKRGWYRQSLFFM
jgi:hypothetical protein